MPEAFCQDVYQQRDGGYSSGTPKCGGPAMFDPLDEVILQLEVVKAEKRRWKAIALTLAGVLGVIVLAFAVMLFGVQRRALIARELAEEQRVIAEENAVRARQAIDQVFRDARDEELKPPL